MKWIGLMLALVALGVAGFGLSFFSEDMVAGFGAEAAERVRPDHRLGVSLAVLTALAVASGLYLRQIKEASLYLTSLASVTLIGAAALLGAANWVFFEPLYAETRWWALTGENLLEVVPGTLGGLVGASSAEDGMLRAAAGAAKGLGRTLVDMVRHPGFEAVPDGPLTLIVALPLLFAFIVFNIGVAPRISARFTADQPLWLRLSAQASLFMLVVLAGAALYLNLLARQSVNFAGTLFAS